MSLYVACCCTAVGPASRVLPRPLADQVAGARRQYWWVWSQGVGLDRSMWLQVTQVTAPCVLSYGTWQTMATAPIPQMMRMGGCHTHADRVLISLVKHCRNARWLQTHSRPTCSLHSQLLCACLPHVSELLPNTRLHMCRALESRGAQQAAAGGRAGSGHEKRWGRPAHHQERPQQGHGARAVHVCECPAGCSKGHVCGAQGFCCLKPCCMSPAVTSRAAFAGTAWSATMCVHHAAAVLAADVAVSLLPPDILDCKSKKHHCKFPCLGT